MVDFVRVSHYIALGSRWGVFFFLNFFINLSHVVVDALGDIRSGNPFKPTSLPVIRSLMGESVAQRKTPMLDWAPIQVRRESDIERPPHIRFAAVNLSCIRRMKESVLCLTNDFPPGPPCW